MNEVGKKIPLQSSIQYQRKATIPEGPAIVCCSWSTLFTACTLS